MNLVDEIQVQQFEARIERVMVQNSIDPVMAKNMEMQAFTDMVTQDLVIRLVKYIAATDARTDIIEWLDYPDTWWDAFKCRFFVGWMQRRWPSKIIHRALTLKQVHMCPHLDIPRGEKGHFRFLWQERMDRITRN